MVETQLDSARFHEVLGRVVRVRRIRLDGHEQDGVGCHDAEEIGIEHRHDLKLAVCWESERYGCLQVGDACVTLLVLLAVAWTRRRCKLSVIHSITLTRHGQTRSDLTHTRGHRGSICSDTGVNNTSYIQP